MTTQTENCGDQKSDKKVCESPWPPKSITGSSLGARLARAEPETIELVLEAIHAEQGNIHAVARRLHVSTRSVAYWVERFTPLREAVEAARRESRPEDLAELLDRAMGSSAGRSILVRVGVESCSASFGAWGTAKVERDTPSEALRGLLEMLSCGAS